MYVHEQWFLCCSVSRKAAQHTLRVSSNRVARCSTTQSNTKSTVCVNTPSRQIFIPETTDKFSTKFLGFVGHSILSLGFCIWLIFVSTSSVNYIHFRVHRASSVLGWLTRLGLERRWDSGEVRYSRRKASRPARPSGGGSLGSILWISFGRKLQT
jgi:hypothetical protein